jgi:hypothetical protein
MSKHDDTPNNSKGSNNQFDVTKLRLTQDFASQIGVKKLLLTIPVRKPNRQEFVRVRKGEDYQLQTAILEMKEDRESFLVDPSLWNELPGEIIPKVILTAMNRQGVMFLWPVRLPGSDGRSDTWNQSALEASNIAEDKWVRVAANMSLGAYDIYDAGSELTDPEWPELEFQKILEIAFKDKFITSMDHPAVRRLRGET